MAKTLLLLGLIAAVAPGQSVGHDLIVSNIDGVNFYGDVGGVSAFSFGATVLNIGDQTIPIIANTPQHPVILMNVFRAEDGRFEQVGRSWVKHMFAAAGPGCTDPNSWLNPGCADTYGAGTNGNQSLLGPPSEINPVTGVFPYPFTAPPVTSVIDRRVQVAHADVDPLLHSGARYFLEVQYIDPSDAADGHGNNNASWREMSFSSPISAGFLPAPATTEQTAIEAWPAVGSGVQLQTIDVPGDGRFHVGLSVQQQNGLWNYEVAVYNMNSHRGVRAVTVSGAPGSTLSSFGFHDCDPHGGIGEPGSGGAWSGADWLHTVNGSDVTWSTDPFFLDVNANALRWGTLNNYRFTSDLPPGLPGTTITLELFRPGTPLTTSVTFAPGASFHIVSGDQQAASAGEPFAQPLVVELLAPGGVPVANQAVGFIITQGAATLSSPFALTDAAGRAQITVTAGTQLGPLRIQAFTAGFSVDFELWVDSLRVFWLPSVGILVPNFTYHAPGIPFVLAIDDPLTAPGFVSSPFGDLHTSVQSPGPGFLLLDGLATGPIGVWSEVFTSLGALANTGITKVFQVYAVDVAAPSPVVISNPVTITF